jgi:hypothetical protein
MLVLRVPRLELVQALPQPLLTPDDVMQLAHLQALLALVRLVAWPHVSSRSTAHLTARCVKNSVIALFVDDGLH